MKKITILITCLALCAALFVVVGSRNSTQRSQSRDEAREVREARRAKNQAEMEHTIDSIVLAKSFQFIPTTMQQVVAGRMNMLSNPNFEVGIWDSTIDIFLPYIKGIAPPYQHTILNYTIPMSNYVTEQTTNGWRVTFSSNLFSASTYTFVFEINSKLGSTNLYLKNPWFETVEYMGTITKFY